MSENKNDNYVLAIDGEEFAIPKKVYDMIKNLSQERDEYFAMVEKCCEVISGAPVNLYGRSELLKEIIAVLKVQRTHRSKNKN